jgi:hypothetical protein
VEDLLPPRRGLGVDTVIDILPEDGESLGSYMQLEHCTINERTILDVYLRYITQIN